MKGFALKDGYMLSISPEMRELVRDKPDMALAEAFKAGRYHGQQEANKSWAAEANRKGGAVQWARKLQSRWPFYEVSAKTGWVPQVQAKRKHK
jgi:hypothetical protein